MAKQPTHLFVYVGHSTQTKNKLQAEFGDYLQSLSGKVVDYDQRGTLVSEIIQKSESLNEKYSRCIPLKVSFESCYSKEGLAISGFYFKVFQLLFGYFDNINPF